MNLAKTLHKQGGINLIKQYWKSGAFWTALNQFIVLGKSRTALEILRLSASLKTKNKLLKKYKKIIRTFDHKYDSTKPHKSSNYVWLCWFQGIDNAPPIVQKCVNSLKNHLKTKQIVVITKSNMNEYVTIPDFIMKKWKEGKITDTHMTDLLRLELLIKYGGTWIDSTVLCTKNEKDIPDYYFNSELFMFQCLKPGRDGHCRYISSWYINAKSNNKILMLTKELCYEYWKHNNYLCDYFLLHQFISICLDYFPDEWKKIMPKNNSDSHILLLNIFDEFDQEKWNYIKGEVPFHKLSYKFSENNTKKPDTFYKYIISDTII